MILRRKLCVLTDSSGPGSPRLRCWGEDSLVLCCGGSGWTEVAVEGEKGGTSPGSVWTFGPTLGQRD